MNGQGCPMRGQGVAHGGQGYPMGVRGEDDQNVQFFMSKSFLSNIYFVQYQNVQNVYVQFYVQLSWNIGIFRENGRTR